MRKFLTIFFITSIFAQQDDQALLTPEPEVIVEDDTDRFFEEFADLPGADETYEESNF